MAEVEESESYIPGKDIMVDPMLILGYRTIGTIHVHVDLHILSL